IRITDAAIIDAVKSGAPDIRFFDTDASVLNHEIEEWDQDNDTASVWVMVPQVDGNSNSDYIMMFYDDKDSASIAGAQSRNMVYDSSYVGVWHLHEDPSSGANSMENSKSSSFYGTPEGTLAGSDSVSGMMGKGLNFSGDDGVNLGDIDITQDLTISAWVKASALVSWGRIVAKAWATNSDPWIIYNMSFDAGGQPISHITTGSADTYCSGSALSTGTWYHITTTYDGSNIRVFTNGSQSGSGAKTGDLNSNNVVTYIGMNNNNGGQNFQGIIDEVRISNTARSADWIKLSYENQKVSQSLVTFE
ncbi:MAG: DUF2341 domain-containing protein, partial [bacterium]|nr:DUF2341 domain-containing protein [bacterium]